jgi:hypothetical protein
MSDAKHWLKLNLSDAFALPPEAVEWLLSIWNIIQLFDDVADGDDISRDDLDSVIWSSLVNNHKNKFFKQHSEDLLPIVETMIFKWQASDRVERINEPDARSFMWRAGYYDLILMAINKVHGHLIAERSAHMVMRLYGENLEDYLKEFERA